MDTMGYGYDAVADEGARAEWKWYVARLEQPVRVVILSTELFWYWGHWIPGRMAPCWKPKCDRCEKGLGRKRNCVVCVVPAAGGMRGLIGVGQEPGLRIQDLAASHGGLRGLTIEAKKTTWAKRSRLEVEWVEQMPACHWEDAPVLDVFEVMVKTWRRSGEEIPAELWDRVLPGVDQAGFSKKKRGEEAQWRVPPVWVPPGPDS